MFIKTQEQNTKQSSASLAPQDVATSEAEKLENALSLYLQSIKLDENQPEWIYGNSITLSAHLNRFDIAAQLKDKAERLYQQSDEIYRAIALLYEKQDRFDMAIEYYQKSIELNPIQPEWVYTKVHNFLLENKLFDRAEKIAQQGMKYFPQSFAPKHSSGEMNSILDRQLTPYNATANSNSLAIRETPKSIEHNVDLNVEQIRHQLMDSSLVEKYEILLEQMLCHVEGDRKTIDTNALVHCLAQIKTDIHYLKTKLFDPDPATVDPQAKQNINIEKIVGLSPAVPVRCELKNRIVGSGWHNAEKHGRWTGAGTISSVILPYPTAGEYRLEIIVRAEAKPGLLNTLKVNVNNQTLPEFSKTEHRAFPAVIRQEITVPEQNQPFLAINLIIAETVNPPVSDTRSIGLLVESISLIPIV